MGYELTIAPDTVDETTVSLATTKGWNDLSAWAVHLPENRFPRLVTLAEEGWSDDAEALSAELDAALDSHTPDDDEVLDTAHDLLVSLEDRGAVPVYVTG